MQPCGYTIRLSAKWALLGAVCPKHGAMALDIPEEAEEAETEAEGVLEMEPS